MGIGKSLCYMLAGKSVSYCFNLTVSLMKWSEEGDGVVVNGSERGIFGFNLVLSDLSNST